MSWLDTIRKNKQKGRIRGARCGLVLRQLKRISAAKRFSECGFHEYPVHQRYDERHNIHTPY
ncbi:hypothetical protein, partial [Klebsiella variicola]|uniref:hypothetical protein n=1 Tax=Klebsiella variicola TaxID=244366 RepID=UPI002B05AA3C